MPNWCQNYIEVYHDDTNQIARLLDAVKSGDVDKGLLNALCPMPDSVRFDKTTMPSGMPAWYEWAVSNWGTKWEVDTDDGNFRVHMDGHKLCVSFDSAWAPPLAAYEAAMGDGFSIDAHYWEPGMAFAGRWHDGMSLEVDYGDMDDLDELHKKLPKTDDILHITEQLREWREQAED
mgnify:CR=1 FL=1